MIKDIYFYWGNETMSYMRYMTLCSFCLLNPDWNVHLIKNNHTSERYLINTIEKQDKTEYKGKDYSDLISKLSIDSINFENNMIDLPFEVVSSMSDVHIKDTLHWKLLGDVGGVVADMDILFIKSITNEIFDDTDIGLVCFKKYPKKDYIPVTFMYSSGSNSFFKNVYQEALKNYKPDVYESCGNLCIKEKNIEEIKKNFSHLKVQRLDDSIVFPFIAHSWPETIKLLYERDNTHSMNEKSIGIHWYAGAPMSQDYNNKINEESVNDITNTMSTCIKRLL
jgi:hypothetical protein